MGWLGRGKRLGGEPEQHNQNMFARRTASWSGTIDHAKRSQQQGQGVAAAGSQQACQAAAQANGGLTRPIRTQH